MAIRTWPIALLLAFPLGPVIAGEPCQPGAKDPIDAWEEAAIASDYSTAGMRDASNTARQMWEKEMNASLDRLLGKLSPSQRESLLASQRAWLAFRDSEGEVISTVVAAQEGTMYQLMATAESMALVKARTLQLRGHEAAIEAP